jgi:hypothetical protein
MANRWIDQQGVKAMGSSHSERLFDIAKQLARRHPGFHEKKGAGLGDLSTNEFMKMVRQEAKKEFEEDFSERNICGKNGFRVDFYFPEDATIVEIALGLNNPLSEFERDVFKAVLANESNNEVKKLIFFSKPGACKRLEQPGFQAIIEWAKQKYGIVIDVWELT